MKCHETCELHNKSCIKTECRYWIDYEDDLNCTLVAVNKNGNMTLRQIGKRLSLSFVRIKQIQDQALNKLNQRMLKLE